MLLALLAGCPETMTTGDTLATANPACGPTDGPARAYIVGTDTCGASPPAPFPRLTALKTTFAAGDHFSVADQTLMAWWHTSEDDFDVPTAATLDVTAVDGDTVTFDWAVEVGGETHAGSATAPFCIEETVVCG